MNHHEAYEQYKRDVREMAERLAPVREPEQIILYLKVAACRVVEDGEEHTTFTCTETGRFGFTEKLVNRLMQCAYDYGAHDIEEQSFRRGYEAARRDFARYLGYDVKEPDQ